ncbi:MAG TPA: twin-arginine translocase TatA/TatE family subunit [Nitrospirota bacterium]|nr:twin-arginine translocase TatA/TatE family subunit [Nitrospirota bacterium]
MFGLGLPELIIILVIVPVIFGTIRLPQLGEGLGKAIKRVPKRYF